MRLLSVCTCMWLLVGCESQAQVSSALVSPYLKIQVALAGDTTEGVNAAAEEIVAAAETLGPEAASLGAAAETMASSEGLQATRDAFAPLSDAFIAYADEKGLGDLKVAYCPMANESWIQADGSISNPYYGSEMLTCGSFR